MTWPNNNYCINFYVLYEVGDTNRIFLHTLLTNNNDFNKVQLFTQIVIVVFIQV